MLGTDALEKVVLGGLATPNPLIITRYLYVMYVCRPHVQNKTTQLLTPSREDFSVRRFHPTKD